MRNRNKMFHFKVLKAFWPVHHCGLCESGLRKNLSSGKVLIRIRKSIPFRFVSFSLLFSLKSSPTCFSSRERKESYCWGEVILKCVCVSVCVCVCEEGLCGGRRLWRQRSCEWRRSSATMWFSRYSSISLLHLYKFCLIPRFTHKLDFFKAWSFWKNLNLSQCGDKGQANTGICAVVVNICFLSAKMIQI